jgi:hypothetical protein
MVGHAWESGHGLHPAVCLFRDDAERERFVEWIREQLMEHGRKSKHPDDTGLRKVAPVVSVDRVLEVTADAMGVTPAALRARRRHSDLRGLAAHMPCRQSGPDPPVPDPPRQTLQRNQLSRVDPNPAANPEFPQDRVQAADPVASADFPDFVKVRPWIARQQFQDIGLGLEPARIELEGHKLR